MPLVEEGELENVASAEEYAAELMLNDFSDISVGIVHGHMKPAEKDEVMKNLRITKFLCLLQRL